jgi:hypothetical protein
MSDDPRANNVLVETLGTSPRYGGTALPIVRTCGDLKIAS